MVTYDFSGFRSGAGEKLVLLRCYAPPQGIYYPAFRSILLVLSSRVEGRMSSSLDIQTTKKEDPMVFTIFTDTQNQIQQRLGR